MAQLLLSLKWDQKDLFGSYRPPKGTAWDIAILNRFIDPKDQNIPSILIHGPTGTGKTHLINAIANEFRAKRPEARIVYLPTARVIEIAGASTGSFGTNRVEAEEGIIAEFISAHADTDLLLIDDIHLLIPAPGDKETGAAQEMLFHLYNHFLSRNAKMAIASRVPPKELESISPHLKSRLLAGVTIETVVPDDSLRVTILDDYCRVHGITAKAVVLEYIVTHYPRDMRTLMSIIAHADSYALTRGRKLSIQVVTESMESFPTREPQK